LSWCPQSSPLGASFTNWQSRGLIHLGSRVSAAAGAGELLEMVLPHDRRRWFQPNADASPVIDEGALGGNSFDNILRGQYGRRSSTLRSFAASYLKSTSGGLPT
jgi:hypothetical protein